MKPLYIYSLGLLLLIKALLELCAGEDKTMRLSKDYICGMDSRVNNGCSWIKSGLKGKLRCAAGCSQNTSCIGISLDQNQACFHRTNCPSVPCMDVEDTHAFYQGCPNGFWNVQQNMCSCPPGTSGINCDNYPQSCYQLVSDGYPIGTYNVLLDPDSSGNPIQVQCIIEAKGGHFVNALLNEGPLNANLSWNDYANGFVIGSTQWIGLEVWNKLYPIYPKATFMIAFVGGSGYRICVYTDFEVQDLGRKYRVKYSSKQVSPVNSQPGGVWNIREVRSDTYFSAFDNDNDEVAGENCAAKNGLGWWYDVTCDLGTPSWSVNDWPDVPAFLPLFLEGSQMSDVLSQVDYLKISLGP